MGSIEEKLGEVVGELRGVQRRLDEAATSRGDLKVQIGQLREGINILKADHRDVTHKLNSLANQIEDIAPKVKTLSEMKTKAAGAILVIGTIGGVIWAFVDEILVWAGFTK